MAYVFEDGEVLSAEKINAHLSNDALPTFRAGVEPVSFTSKASHTQEVLFSTPIPEDRPVPAVTATISSGAGPTATWDVRAITITRTGFTLFLFGPSQTWAGVPVSWIAATPQ